MSAEPEIVLFESSEVRAGRELAKRLIGTLGELVDRGELPTDVWIRQEAAECMAAFFRHCGRGGMPTDLCGIPLRVGQTGGKAFAIVLADRRAVEH